MEEILNHVEKLAQEALDAVLAVTRPEFKDVVRHFAAEARNKGCARAKEGVAPPDYQHELVRIAGDAAAEAKKVAAYWGSDDSEVLHKAARECMLDAWYALGRIEGYSAAVA